MTPQSWTVLGRFYLHRGGEALLLQPLGLARRRRQRPQGRRHTLLLIDLVQEAAEVLGGVREVDVAMAPAFLVFAGAHETLGLPIPRRRADGGPTGRDPAGVRRLAVRGRGRPG